MARRRATPRWVCPLCYRSVPAAEPTCYCGTSRAAVEAHARRERERTRKPFPWRLFLGELGLVAIVVYWVFGRGEPPEALPSRSSVAPAVTSRAAPSVATETSRPPVALPTPTPLPPAEEGEPKPAAAPPTPGSLKPATPAPPERTETDLEREAGEKRLEQSLARLGSVMAQLSENARQFEATCLGRRGEPRSCARLHDDMASAGEALARGLESAEDEARRASIPPGVVRDLRQKHGMEEDTWNNLQDKVRRLTAQYQGNS